MGRKLLRVHSDTVSLLPRPDCEMGTITIPTAQMQKLRLKMCLWSLGLKETGPEVGKKLPIVPSQANSLCLTSRNSCLLSWKKCHHTCIALERLEGLRWFDSETAGALRGWDGHGGSMARVLAPQACSVASASGL